MDRRTYDALMASIEHWKENVRAADRDAGHLYASVDAMDCALCRCFRRRYCAGCPVSDAMGGEIGCTKTPYDDAAHAYRKWPLDGPSPEFGEHARRELEFLQALVPAGGPDEPATS